MNAPEPIETKPAPPRSDWVEYELRKSTWAMNHPEATPAEYQDAIRRISQECGV